MAGNAKASTRLKKLATKKAATPFDAAASF